MINLAFEAFEQLSSSDVCKLKSLQPGTTVLREKKRANKAYRIQIRKLDDNKSRFVSKRRELGEMLFDIWQ